MPTKKFSEEKVSVERLTALVTEQWDLEIAGNYLKRISESLEVLSDEEVWWRPNEASNSVGNLILHLCGNMRQWIISGLGDAVDTRKRDLEFSERGPIPRNELIDKLRGTVKEAGRVIARLSAAELAKNYNIQGFAVTGYEALVHVTVHVGYHAGQIVYIAKMKRAKDLGLTKLPALPAKKSK
jgi:uncharacterized damage-inducible protein DinB